MAVNSAGLQIIADGGIPQTITGYAAEVISGGEYVQASGTGGVSSGTNSFVTSDLTLLNQASGTNMVGIAAHNVASGAKLTVYTKGIFLTRVNGTCTVSLPQVANGNEAVADGTTAGQVIGKTLHGGTSGNYALLRLDL